MRRHILWVGLFVLAMLCFAVMYAFYKACSSYLPNTVIIFFQSLCSLIIILPFVLKDGKKALVTHKLPKIALRCIFGLLALYLLSLALKWTGLSEAVLLNNTSPLYIPLIVWLWHKTRVPHKLWASLITGFIGIFVILRPGFAEINVGLVFAASSGIAAACMLVVMRQIAHEPFIRVLFYYFLFFCLATSPFLWLNWTSPPPIVWLYLVLAGVMMICAQIAMTVAMRHATAHEVAPFLYTNVIFAGLIDWIVWKVTPDYISVIGMVIVFIGCVSTLLISTKKESHEEP